ncbi:CRISPR-associated protein, Crm2 family [Thalassoporum mexicanum PCC 7367]|uniref:type III-B CRISPR-associated protein Cas10/Cmr2 n=1 Tax=Thalassoporum mexicanum TaxID=3457544 RepID=UPI00029FB442|nr:type III-B CRISPR-associated protein Cas10/Cmr2 [Pseudanabaena sp. PCC 7367]AFY68749.1 CRISPR-associated protein, Crm2 family [Pseudanabaena sp. PCC 7367]
MPAENQSTAKEKQQTTIALSWCLAWGDQKEPNFDRQVLLQMRDALISGQIDQVPAAVASIVEQVQELQNIKIQEGEFGKAIDTLTNDNDYAKLVEQEIKIGLVYGGATKIKQYVFEAAKLPGIRGASALLDRINLADLPAFFEIETDDQTHLQVKDEQAHLRKAVNKWLNKNGFGDLKQALIPELKIYSTGGNILALCPAFFVNHLADAIEKRYTDETMTANSCAVGEKFSLLEFRFGLLNQENIRQTPWLNDYWEKRDSPIVRSQFNAKSLSDEGEFKEVFRKRKSFNELVAKLATKFEYRRNGNDFEEGRSPRCYPPMFETHPYLVRDSYDSRTAIAQVEDLPGQPWMSEPLARKRVISEKAKRGEDLDWWERIKKAQGIDWDALEVDSWIVKFQDFLKDNPGLGDNYYADFNRNNAISEVQSVVEIGDRNGYIAYIYADGNNMGGHIQTITDIEGYKIFSQEIFKATENSVYKAIAQHLHPYQLKNLSSAQDTRNKNGDWIHPFEIITIGGDDVLLIVPANKALEIAIAIGEEFENILCEFDREREKAQRKYKLEHDNTKKDTHRHSEDGISLNKVSLSMSTGVLITSSSTPIYYADKLVSQLLKSAKKKAKNLKTQKNYYGGTIDFLVMKAVTMISSNITSFRDEALTVERNQKLKLYAAPYTLAELNSLINIIRDLKELEFPKSQLYQIRDLLKFGKNTAILNYRYFRTRLKKGQKKLKQDFEEAWCKPKNQENKGNLAPWLSVAKEDEGGNLEIIAYETIWRELIDLYPFIEEENVLMEPIDVAKSSREVRANG